MKYLKYIYLFCDVTFTEISLIKMSKIVIFLILTAPACHHFFPIKLHPLLSSTDTSVSVDNSRTLINDMGLGPIPNARFTPRTARLLCFYLRALSRHFKWVICQYSRSSFCCLINMSVIGNVRETSDVRRGRQWKVLLRRDVVASWQGCGDFHSSFETTRAISLFSSVLSLIAIVRFVRCESHCPTSDGTGTVSAGFDFETLLLNGPRV